MFLSQQGSFSFSSKMQRLLDKRQGEIEGCSRAFLTFHPDSAVMAFDETRRYRQSQTEALSGALIRSFNSVKRKSKRVGKGLY